MSFVVLLDVDGVLANLQQHIHTVVENVTGVKPIATGWKFEEYMTEEMSEVAYQYMSCPGVAFNLPLMEGAKEGWDLLESHGCTIKVVTSSFVGNKSWEWDRRAWFTEHFPEFNRSLIHFTADKEAVDGDVLIDDKPKHIERWSSARRKRGMLFDWPFSANMMPSTSRFSWKELLSLDWGGFTFPEVHKQLSFAYPSMTRALEKLKTANSMGRGRYGSKK